MEINEILEKLVSINSVYPGEGSVARWLEKYLKENSWKLEKQKVGENRHNLFATKGCGSRSILFYGHMDTVPTNEDNWDTDPFCLTNKGNKYYGLGAYDMKGGMAAFLNAASESDAYVKLFMTVDEENISLGAWRAVEEKADFFEDVELVVSAEPNFGLGLHGITTSRTGRCIFEVSFKGTSKHIAEYEEGEDAILMASEFVELLYKKRKRLFSSRDTVVQVRKIEAEAMGMSVCGEAKLEVEVLLGVGEKIKTIQKILKMVHKEARVTLKSRETPYLEGYSFNNFPYQKTIEKIIKNNMGTSMKLHSRKSVGDDNVLATLKVPVVTWGPDGGNAHSANEYVEMDSLIKLSKMYSEFLNKSRYIPE